MERRLEDEGALAVGVAARDRRVRRERDARRALDGRLERGVVDARRDAVREERPLLARVLAPRSALSSPIRRAVCVKAFYMLDIPLYMRVFFPRCALQG